ncbi:MAG: hypothetical protein ACJAW3_000138 [Lentimonas sp.]|jgi:hypothetical protein
MEGLIPISASKNPSQGFKSSTSPSLDPNPKTITLDKSSSNDSVSHGSRITLLKRL